MFLHTKSVLLTQSLRRKVDGLTKTEKDVGKLSKQLREIEEYLNRSVEAAVAVTSL